MGIEVAVRLKWNYEMEKIRLNQVFKAKKKFKVKIENKFLNAKIVSKFLIRM